MLGGSGLSAPRKYSDASLLSNNIYTPGYTTPVFTVDFYGCYCVAVALGPFVVVVVVAAGTGAAQSKLLNVCGVKVQGLRDTSPLL